MDLELEDSVQSLQAPADVEEEVVKPRKLGRLRKAGAVENAQPNRAAAPASPGQLGRNAAQATSDGDLTAPRRPAAPEEEAVVAGDTAAAPSGCQASALQQGILVSQPSSARWSLSVADMCYCTLPTALSMHSPAGYTLPCNCRRSLTLQTTMQRS